MLALPLLKLTILYSFVLCISVSASENGFAGGRLTSIEACSLNAPLWLIKGDNPESSFRLCLDSQLCCAVFGPFNPYKAALFCDNLFELFVTVGMMGVLILKCFCSLKKRLLNLC